MTSLNRTRNWKGDSGRNGSLVTLAIYVSSDKGKPDFRLNLRKERRGISDGKYKQLFLKILRKWKERNGTVAGVRNVVLGVHPYKRYDHRTEDLLVKAIALSPFSSLPASNKRRVTRREFTSCANTSIFQLT